MCLFDFLCCVIDEFVLLVVDEGEVVEMGEEFDVLFGYVVFVGIIGMWFG